MGILASHLLWLVLAVASGGLALASVVLTLWLDLEPAISASFSD